MLCSAHSTFCRRGIDKFYNCWDFTFALNDRILLEIITTVIHFSSSERKQCHPYSFEFMPMQNHFKILAVSDVFPYRAFSSAEWSIATSWCCYFCWVPYFNLALTANTTSFREFFSFWKLKCVICSAESSSTLVK